MNTGLVLGVIGSLLAMWALFMARVRSHKSPRIGHRDRNAAASSRAATRSPGGDASRRLKSHSIVVSVLIIVAFGSLLGELADRHAGREARFRALASPWTQEDSRTADVAPSLVDDAAGSPPVRPTVTATPSPTTEVALAVGDPTECPKQDPSVPNLAKRLSGPILAVGDLVDPDGSLANYAACYEPLWGGLKSRIWPVPGNHDYGTTGAGPYFSYFGDRAGEPGKGYYSFEIGAWHVIALNSVCLPVGGCNAGSDQARWLATDLAAHPSDCILAFWHHPFYSSGNGAEDRVQVFWEMLYDAGAEIVVNGHDHHYERFAPMTPNGDVDREGGIRQFTVGTGGGTLTAPDHSAANSEILNNSSHGVLQLTLHPGSYEWEFIPAGEGGFRDSGEQACSGPAPRNASLRE